MLRKLGWLLLAILLYFLACWFRNLRDDTIYRILMGKDDGVKWKRRIKYFLFSVLYFVFCFLSGLSFLWGFLSFFSISITRKIWLSEILALSVALLLLLFSVYKEVRKRLHFRKEEELSESLNYEDLLSEKKVLTKNLALENEKYDAYFQNEKNSKHSSEAMKISKKRSMAIWKLCEVERQIARISGKEQGKTE